MNWSGGQNNRIKVITGPGTPTKRIMMPDGTMRVEKLCPIPNNVKMVSPDGNVVCLPLANNWVDRSPNSEYAQLQLAIKTKAGFIRYDQCPIATGVLPPGKNDKACTGKFSRDECCPHVEKVIAARRAVKQKANAKFAASMETAQDKLIKLAAAQATAGAPAAKGLKFGD